MAELQSVRSRRQLSLPLSTPAATHASLADYLGLVDRPLTSLLARERLTQEGPGSFTYRSNPHQVLHWEVVPMLCLRARWEGDRLAVSSTRCRLTGLGDWGESVGFHLEAVLQPAEQALTGWAEVALTSRVASLPGARSLAQLALEHVLDRMERRVGAGLRKDVLAWLGGNRPEGQVLG